MTFDTIIIIVYIAIVNFTEHIIFVNLVDGMCKKLKELFIPSRPL